VDPAVYTRSGHSLAQELHFPDTARTPPEGEVCVAGFRPEDFTYQPDGKEAGLSHGTMVTHVIAADRGDGVTGVASGLRDKLTVTVAGYDLPGVERWLERDAVDPANDLGTFATGYFGTDLARVAGQVSKGAKVIEEILVRTGTSKMSVGGKTVKVPAEVGGRVLRVDMAVLEVINQR
jgi:hypothetical protein